MSRTFSSMYKNNYSSDYISNLSMKCSKTCAINNNDYDNIYLKITDAALTYLTINDANANYLKIVDASTNYLKIVDASLNYLKIVDASANYLKIVDASTNYLKILDASANYLKILDASLNYLKILDASLNYLRKVDASNNYLSRVGVATSIATATTFTGTLSTISPLTVSGYLLSVAGDSVGLSQSAVASIRATHFGSGAAAGNDGVGFGYQAIGGGTSCLAFGRSATTGAIALNGANNCCAIGSSSSTALNINYQTAIGSAASCSAVKSTAIGYGASATVANSIVLGTATETVYCPGAPSSGSTTNTCLVLSSNVLLPTTNYTKAANNLGYNVTPSATVANATSLGNSSTVGVNYYTFTSLPIGVYHITCGLGYSCDTPAAPGYIICSASTTSVTQSTTNQILQNTTTGSATILNNYLNYTTTIANTSVQTWYIILGQRYSVGTYSTLVANSWVNMVRIA